MTHVSCQASRSFKEKKEDDEEKKYLKKKYISCYVNDTFEKGKSSLLLTMHVLRVNLSFSLSQSLFG